MKIYTRTGDQGTTSLFGGAKVKKNHIQIEAFGSVDELNAFLGFIKAQIDEKISSSKISTKKIESKISENILKKYKNLLNNLSKIQNQLFEIGSHLASANEKVKKKLKTFNSSQIKEMENLIDEQEKHLPKLTQFILPGGSPLSASFHLARTVARRAERTVLSLNEKKPLDPFILKYLNRLSDLLFIFARISNQLTGQKEILWDSTSST